MRILIESTDEIGTINGVECRKWLGKTDAGTPCFVFVPRIAVAREHEAAFERERKDTLRTTGVGDKADGPSRPVGSFDVRAFS